MKVAHCISELDIGGAETTLCKTVTRMNVEGHSSLVVSLSDSGLIGEQIKQAGIPVFTLGAPRGKPTLGALLNLRRLLAREKPDLLQTYMYYANLYGWLAGRSLGIPVVWEILCSEVDFSHYNPASRLAYISNRWLSRMPAAIVFNSNAGQAYHIRQGFSEKKMAVIPNGFDLDHFQPDAVSRAEIRAELGLLPDAILVGRFGRYDPLKDFATLLQAASRVCEQHARVYFVFAGPEGITSSNLALAESIRASKLDQKILLLGRRDEMPRLTASLDIAVSCSTSEGSPSVVGEAMACAVPCVVTDVGDSAFIVGETGRVVLPRDPDALADAIGALVAMSDAERRQLGQAARRRVTQYFDIANAVRTRAQLYHRLVGEDCE